VKITILIGSHQTLPLKKTDRHTQTNGQIDSKGHIQSNPLPCPNPNPTQLGHRPPYIPALSCTSRGNMKKNPTTRWDLFRWGGESLGKSQKTFKYYRFHRDMVVEMSKKTRGLCITKNTSVVCLKGVFSKRLSPPKCPPPTWNQSNHYNRSVPCFG